METTCRQLTYSEMLNSTIFDVLPVRLTPIEQSYLLTVIREQLSAEPDAKDDDHFCDCVSKKDLIGLEREVSEGELKTGISVTTCNWFCWHLRDLIQHHNRRPFVSEYRPFSMFREFKNSEDQIAEIRDFRSFFNEICKSTDRLFRSIEDQINAIKQNHVPDNK